MRGVSFFGVAGSSFGLRGTIMAEERRQARYHLRFQGLVVIEVG
ncbi:MAG: hypothetical protein ACUVWR_13495 [Anaerolineae bacterium]